MTPSTPPRLTTLILLTAFSPLTLNMFLPSLANMAADLRTDYATVSLAVAGYLAATAAVQLIIGPLSDRIGRRPVILGSLGAFAVASAGCALAEDVWTFLAFRMAQSGMSAGFAISLAIVRDTREEREAASMIGYISMIMAIGPMIAPAVGGLLDAGFGWRAIFWFYAAAGVGLFALCWFDLGETRRRRPESRSRVETLTLFTSAPFWAFALCVAFSTGAFYIFLAGAPFVAAAIFGMPTSALGIYIGSITAGFMTGGFIAGRLGRRLDVTTLMLLGRVSACLGPIAGLALIGFGVLHPLAYFAATIFVGLGNGLTTPGANAGAVSVQPDLAGAAAGVTAALTVGLGAVLTMLAGWAMEPEGGHVTLLAMILASSAVGLAAAIMARMLRRREKSAVG